MEEREREKKRAEIVDLLNDASRPRPRRRRAPVPAIQVNGNCNVITVGGVVRIEKMRDAATRPSGNVSHRALPPPSRRKAWREEVVNAIWTCAWDINLNPDELFALVSKKLGRCVTSLSKASEQDLGWIYEWIAALDRPGLKS
ncbi:MAG TPA: hypothetical protein VMV27_02000 [Candidatus Binataceae bacterium]|nr:hypothetical protein [Candidatus Binataceae bacterium]